MVTELIRKITGYRIEPETLDIIWQVLKSGRKERPEGKIDLYRLELAKLKEVERHSVSNRPQGNNQWSIRVAIKLLELMINGPGKERVGRVNLKTAARFALNREELNRILEGGSEYKIILYYRKLDRLYHEIVLRYSRYWR